MKASTFDPIKYKNDYTAENYDRLSVALPKGYKERLKRAAEAQGVSVTEIIKRAIDNAI